jgi:hypothetical protein
MEQRDIDSYFNSTVLDPTKRALRKEVLPEIDEAFAGPGFWNAARSHDKSQAVTNTADRLSEQYAQLNWDALGRNQSIDEADANRRIGAVSPALAYGQIPAQEIKNNLDIAASKIGGLNQIFGIGSTEQTQGQMELEAEIQKFAEENQITDPDDLMIIMSLLGMNFSQSQSKGSSESFGINMNMQG